ncbi:hypothetical protein QBC46DRAFT_394230 [Diplogelasinospora grovesii]|uniref:Ubiquitin-like domain-containing protein n=1 Tax=Diplogelasinospora grovesii TaxID=303347 RepID=A0AAN6S1R2_9PEZI|nr:hypothetical protein QBC46DRAFT_394230 [Diplogelasinospora grovesii]
MSFGYSVGDVMGGANLAYQLLRIMADTKGASREYQEAMSELGAIQQAFIQVSHMKSHEMMPQATINGAEHIVMSSMDTLAKFLERTKTYQRRLSNPHDRSFQSSWCKVGWTLYKAHELRALRDTLHSKLTSVNTLLMAASYYHPLPVAIARYRVDDSDRRASLPPEQETKEPGTSELSTTLRGQTDNIALSEPNPSIPSLAQQTSSIANQTIFQESISSMPQRVVKASVPLSISHDTVGRVAELTGKFIKAESPGAPAALGLQLKEIRDLLSNLSGIQKPQQENLYIKFKDAVGRKFSFPFGHCHTWQGMEELITQAFLHVDVIGPHVREGHYDLMGPNGDIILPSIWERVIQPDWAVTMHMWPMDKTPGPLAHGIHGGLRDMRGLQIGPSGARSPGGRIPGGLPPTPSIPPGGWNGGGRGREPVPGTSVNDRGAVNPGKLLKRSSASSGASVLRWMAGGTHQKAGKSNKKHVAPEGGDGTDCHEEPLQSSMENTTAELRDFEKDQAILEEHDSDSETGNGDKTESGCDDADSRSGSEDRCECSESE